VTGTLATAEGKPAAAAAAISPLRAEAIRTLYAQMRYTNFATMVITLYMVGVSWAFTDHQLILAWAAAVLAAAAVRELLIARFRKRAPEGAALERWAFYYVVHQFVVGLLWGSTVFLFAHVDQPITVALTLCCLYSIGAGSVPAQSYTPASLNALVGTVYGLILIRFVATADFDYILLGSASALYGLTMVAYCRVQHRTLMEGFQIRFENRELVEALTTQKAAADDARHKAEVANLAKSQFLAAASHDLRQPLYAMSLFSASLGEPKLDPEGRAVVGRIQDSIAVMESLFEGLLDVSKLDAGVVQPRLADVPVDALFDRISQVFRPIAIDRGLDLRFRCDGEWVRSDPVLLEQVLSNLVSNAIRCTARGGVLVAARGRGEAVRLEVWDTGIGIAEPDRNRIFEEFVQLGNPERDRRKGLGLGLAIAQRSAALIGGTIDLASRPGVGSRFGLAQPRAAPPARDVPMIEILAAPCLPASQDKPVMIVDDDVEVRAALSDLMTRWRIRCRVFASADAALQSLADGDRYRLVLADYRLGGRMNGLELLAAIASRHPAPRPPMVLITGDFDAGLVGAAHAQQVELLHKPLRPEALRNLVGAPA
jgi:signal transduction histidine kinase